MVTFDRARRKAAVFNIMYGTWLRATPEEMKQWRALCVRYINAEIHRVPLTLEAFRRQRVPYDHAVLVEVLVAHQRMDSRACLCGFDRLGASHCEHVADEYEKAMAAREASCG